ncbi:hypothetical protein C0991_007490 [Blastosporella zonata]|nr:hypothetical protein C0991_007490 [Blastosporella zonata]
MNYLLVWGPGPTRVGFIGAPIASALSTCLISLVSVIHGVYLVPRTAWHPLSMKMFTNLGLLVRLGLSGIGKQASVSMVFCPDGWSVLLGQLASEWWAWELVALAASFFGPTALAAQSILLSTAATVFQLGHSIANATAIRVGNLLGEKNAQRAEITAKTSFSWARLFNNDEVVVELVSNVLPLIALYQIVDGNSSVTGGILRVRGQQVNI